jgi:hypothetical protein
MAPSTLVICVWTNRVNPAFLYKLCRKSDPRSFVADNLDISKDMLYGSSKKFFATRDEFEQNTPQTSGQITLRMSFIYISAFGLRNSARYVQNTGCYLPPELNKKTPRDVVFCFSRVKRTGLLINGSTDVIVHKVQFLQNQQRLSQYLMFALVEPRACTHL